MIFIRIIMLCLFEWNAILSLLMVLTEDSVWSEKEKTFIRNRKKAIKFYSGCFAFFQMCATPLIVMDWCH